MPVPNQSPQNKALDDLLKKIKSSNKIIFEAIDDETYDEIYNSIKFKEIWDQKHKFYSEFEINNLFSFDIIDYLRSKYKDMTRIPRINFNSSEKRKEILQFYVDVFEEIPSGSHMIRAYTQMEKLVLELFEQAKIDGTEEMEKRIQRFDKLKSLALGNANMNERKVAFRKSLEEWMRISNIKLELKS